MSQYKELFVSEVAENLKQLRDGLATLGKSPKRKDLLNELMRFSHSIKGASATMGYVKMACLTHVMEDIFDYARQDKLKINSGLIEIVCKCLEQLEESLEQIKDNDQEIDLTLEAKNLIEITGVVTKATDSLGHEVNGKGGIDGDQEELNKKSNNAAEQIKVSITILDLLFDLSEELIGEKMAFEKLCSKLEKKGHKYLELKSGIDRLNHLVNEMQHQIVRARLEPVDQVFSMFSIMVNDLAKTQGKEINFSMKGGEIEFDRNIIEKIVDPMIHLLRNAVDHGIDKKGIIKINIGIEKGLACISIEDNGRGLDLGKMIEKALEMKIISSKSEGHLREKIPSTRPATMPKIFEKLFFSSQISTNEVITEVSGRGVGMNVVKEFVNSAGGTIKVELLEKGTRFNIHLPFSLAIMRALLVKVGAKKIAIPIFSIENSVFVKTEDIRNDKGKNVVAIDGKDVPLISLKSIIEIVSENAKDVKIPVVLINARSNKFAIVVDEVMKEQEVIVKPLSSELNKNKYFSCTTLIGNCQKALMIDVNYSINTLSDKK